MMATTLTMVQATADIMDRAIMVTMPAITVAPVNMVIKHTMIQVTTDTLGRVITGNTPIMDLDIMVTMPRTSVAPAITVTTDILAHSTPPVIIVAEVRTAIMVLAIMVTVEIMDRATMAVLDTTVITRA